MIQLLEDENGHGEKTPLKIGMNTIFWHGKNRVFDIREIPTIFSGLCYVILPHNVSSDPGDRFTFEFFSSITLEEDQLGEIKIEFSSKDAFLNIVWVGMNGIETQKFEMSLDKYSSLVAFYNEIENHYIKNCDEVFDSVFVNFAWKFVKHRQNFTCNNVCVPLYFEPIANLRPFLLNCVKAEDYYCMYLQWNLIASMGSEILKPCVVQHPKISGHKVAKTPSTEDQKNPKEHTFHLIVDLGDNREVNQEYFIPSTEYYDTLSLIGTIGGTLGLFLGFSFYSCIVALIDCFAARWEKYRPASVNSIDTSIVLRSNNREENLNSTRSRNYVTSSVGESPQRRHSISELSETDGADTLAQSQPEGRIMPPHYHIILLALLVIVFLVLVLVLVH